MVDLEKKYKELEFSYDKQLELLSPEEVGRRMNFMDKYKRNVVYSINSESNEKIVNEYKVLIQ